MTATERFWGKVEKTETCWLWTAHIDRPGYGHLQVDGRSVRAHRFAYELLVGPIPPGLDLDHFRMNPGPRHAPCAKACVNPTHLEPVTRGENSLRGVGFFAANARKTHCIHGHSLADAYVYAGRRDCRECYRTPTEKARRLLYDRARRARARGAQ